ncbi:MAG: DUF6305 family protein [Candidatus Aminicenantes bacterium]|nr:DUF6305 family protein [Candidatus Aminicenantes bacterium]
MERNVPRATAAAFAFFFFCCVAFLAFFPAQERVQTPAAVFDPPLLITSVGQSPDVQLAVVLAKRAGLEHTLVKMATEKDLAGVKSVALVFGASLKGLGAAGVDTAKEKARVRALLAEAARRKIPVLGLHLGGDQRRGELTDEFVVEFLPAADMAVIVKSANKDGLFTRVCGAGSIPLVEVEKTADAADVLKNVFKPKA